MNLTEYVEKKDREILKAAQELWKQRGYYTGAIDGIWGPKSEAAYNRYTVRPTLVAEPSAKVEELSGLKIIRKPTVNHGGGHTPHTIVLHYCGGYWKGTQSHVADPKTEVSYHYYVSREGEVIEFVPPNRVAWHVRGYNTGYIGISVQGNTDNGQYRDGQKDLNPVEVKTVVALIKAIQKVYTIKNITTHRVLDPTRRSDISPGAEKQIRDALK